MLMDNLDRRSMVMVGVENKACLSLVDKYNFLSEFAPSRPIHCELVQNYIHNIIYQQPSSEKSLTS